MQAVPLSEFVTEQAPSQAPVLGALRTATRSHHENLESLLQLGQPFTRPHYLQVLQGFAAFLPAWEQRLQGALPAPLRPWFDARRRAHLVLKDLAALGLPAPDQPVVAESLPPLPTTAAAFGSLYVIEGSAVGGQLISRVLAERHGIGPGSGGAYFFGAGPRTGALWREFRERLAQAVTTPLACSQACTAAAHTFDALAATFRTRLTHEPSAA